MYNGKLLVVAIAGRETEYLSPDLLYDFRLFAKKYENDNRYVFALLDVDDEVAFKWLTSFNIGRFDSPGVFAIKDIENEVYYRNYEIYSGDNFPALSTEFLEKIENGEKVPLHMRWSDAYKNLKNIEYWLNNKVKAYIYSIGILSISIIPWIILIDCYKPILGRGPFAKLKREK